ARLLANEPQRHDSTPLLAGPLVAMYSAHSEPTDRYFISAAFCISACMLAACGQENRYVAPPPPQVSVAIPVQQEVTRYLETTGNTAAVNTVNLVARVQGFLEKIEYRDGDEVKAGTTRFVIEPEPYQLKLEQAQAAE